MTLRNSLEKARYQTEWMTYLHKGEIVESQAELAFFETCLAHLSEEKQKAVYQEIEKSDRTQAESKLYELLVYELYYRLCFCPEFQPVYKYNGNRLTPDLAFVKGEQIFLCDVFSIQSPTKQVEKSHDENGRSLNGGHRARNVTDRIEQKIRQYRVLPYPLVLCVFLRDRYSFGLRNVEESVLGFTSCEIQRMDNYPREYPRGQRREGVFLPTAHGEWGSPNLSAVVYCDWYWTLQEPHERRMFCYVMHHWNPKVPLPLDVFENFVQLTWKEHNGNYSPVFSKPSNVVAKFLTNGGIEYSHDNPPKVRVQWG